jgi:hypothetical protein
MADIFWAAMHLDLAYIRKLERFFAANPCLGFDARSEILYPLLDKTIKKGDVFRLELANGLRFEYTYTSSIAKEILLREDENPSHAWEPMTTKSIELIMDNRPGAALIGGAYFGDHALIAARQLQRKGNTSSVLCIEPNGRQGELLVKNATANNLQDLIIWNKSVLWDQPGCRFNLGDQDSHASVKEDHKSTYISDTIDNILASHSIHCLALLMLDIEGSEEKALVGATTILGQPASCAPVVIVEVHRSYVNWDHGLGNTGVVKLLLSHGYHVYALRDCQSNWELGLKKSEIIPLDKVYLEGPPHGFNLIASKSNNFFDDLGFKQVSHVSPKYLRHRDPRLHFPIASHA